MTNATETQLGDRVDICDVCEVPLTDLKDVIEVEKMANVLTFCSEECYKEYLEEPERYTAFADDDDE